MMFLWLFLCIVWLFLVFAVLLPFLRFIFVAYTLKSFFFCMAIPKLQTQHTFGQSSQSTFFFQQTFDLELILAEGKSEKVPIDSNSHRRNLGLQGLEEQRGGHDLGPSLVEDSRQVGPTPGRHLAESISGFQVSKKIMGFWDVLRKTSFLAWNLDGMEDEDIDGYWMRDCSWSARGCCHVIASKQRCQPSSQRVSQTKDRFSLPGSRGRGGALPNHLQTLAGAQLFSAVWLPEAWTRTLTVCNMLPCCHGYHPKPVLDWKQIMVMRKVAWSESMPLCRKDYEGCKTGLKDLFGSYAKSPLAKSEEDGYRLDKQTNQIALHSDW